EITRVLDAKPDEHVFGLSLVLARDRTFFVADTAVHETPNPTQLADFAIQTASVARRMGHEPRVAFLSFSNFGNPMLERSSVVRDAVKVLDEQNVPFEYDGDMGVDVALNKELLALYPFCRLTGPANVLIMPGLHTSKISTNLLHELGGGTVIGPMLMGLSKPAQIVPMGATVSDMVNMAALAAHDAI
ncbi:MAG: NADP-dependent malic enzyme, partial [Rhodospirillales bacterium]|nr:NADP-dependent malic enzyme [Rhodospirillales bacterium]